MSITTLKKLSNKEIDGMKKSLGCDAFVLITMQNVGEITHTMMQGNAKTREILYATDKLVSSLDDIYKQMEGKKKAAKKAVKKTIKKVTK